MTDTASTARRVVIHAFDGPGDVERALGTAGALRKAFPDAHLRIIVNGEALTAVPSLDPTTIPENVQMGVCQVGLHRRHIDEGSIPEGVEIVPTAPVAIVQEQFDGAAYIRL